MHTPCTHMIIYAEYQEISEARDEGQTTKSSFDAKMEDVTFVMLLICARESQ